MTVTIRDPVQPSLPHHVLTMKNGVTESVFERVDTRSVPDCFSRFPAGISVVSKRVEAALRKIGLEASKDGSRERRRALIRHSNPFGDPFAICHCSATPERLVLLASIVEVMWIHDDVTEELDYQSACHEHSVLADVLRLDVDPVNLVPQSSRQRPLAAVLRKAIDLDPAQAPMMLETLKRYLDTFDSNDDDFDRMDAYMPYRIANCGYWISSFFIRWGMGLTMTDEDYESIRLYDEAMGNVLGLTNDYFSWNIEKNQPTDRIRNGVRVIMQEYNVPAEIAKSALLGIIVEEESRAARMKEERLRKSSASEAVIRYFEAIELYVGGSCYWHSTAPRYRVYE